MLSLFFPLGKNNPLNQAANTRVSPVSFPDYPLKKTCWNDAHEHNAT